MGREGTKHFALEHTSRKEAVVEFQACVLHQRPGSPRVLGGLAVVPRTAPSWTESAVANLPVWGRQPPTADVNLLDPSYV
ncbi:unnamed protein product [Pleuronectes platessa]|uniref:Uncharacterized protein n=1 Tax=Pleuronectes platessa TaxID=8262 RepID=A0A9N7VSY6_PLEPL|nr:unnamed protein product [Pleuronectes platessa]